MPEERAASRPAAGAARGTVAGAIAAATSAYVIGQTGSVELAMAAGALAGGVVTYIGKLLRKHFPEAYTPV